MKKINSSFQAYPYAHVLKEKESYSYSINFTIQDDKFNENLKDFKNAKYKSMSDKYFDIEVFSSSEKNNMFA